MFREIIKIASLVMVTTSLSFSLSVIELNKSSKEVLMKINGVGAKKADAIIEYRKKTAFQNIDDVQNVKGVGKKLAENIKNDVYKKSVKSKKVESKKDESEKK